VARGTPDLLRAAEFVEGVVQVEKNGLDHGGFWQKGPPPRGGGPLWTIIEVGILNQASSVFPSSGSNRQGDLE
jgi:hypothetical protein